MEDLTKAKLIKIARNLQSGYSKDMHGSSRKWDEVDAAEQQTWIRTVRRAVRLLNETDRIGADAARSKA